MLYVIIGVRACVRACVLVMSSELSFNTAYPYSIRILGTAAFNACIIRERVRGADGVSMRKCPPLLENVAGTCIELCNN